MLIKSLYYYYKREEDAKEKIKNLATKMLTKMSLFVWTKAGISSIKQNKLSKHYQILFTTKLMMDILYNFIKSVTLLKYVLVTHISKQISTAISVEVRI